MTNIKSHSETRSHAVRSHEKHFSDFGTKHRKLRQAIIITANWESTWDEDETKFLI